MKHSHVFHRTHAALQGDSIQTTSRFYLHLAHCLWRPLWASICSTTLQGDGGHGKMRQSSVAMGGSIARVPVCTLVLLCLAGVCQEPCHAAPRPRSSDRGSSIHGGPRGLAKTVRPRGRTRTVPAYGDSDAWNTAVAEPSAPDGKTVEVTRRQELESLRQLLEGGKETLDQAVDREEQQREEEEEKERVRSERDKMRRERAGEVAFLRSLAIRDAQGSFVNLAGAASTAQNMQVGDVSNTAVPLTDREPSNTTTGDGSGLHRVDGPDVDQGGGVDNKGRKPSRWAKIMEEEGLSENVGADALDSMPEFDDLGSTMSAQANLHAEQVVQRAMLRLEQVLSALSPSTLCLLGARRRGACASCRRVALMSRLRPYSTADARSAGRTATSAGPAPSRPGFRD